MRPFVAIQSIATPALKPVLILLAADRRADRDRARARLGAAGGVRLRRRPRRARAADPPSRGRERSPRRASIGALAREFWAFSAPRGVAAAFQITIIWFDLLLLSHLRDASEVGIYGAASRAVMIGTFALQAIRLAIAPQISRLLARGDRDQAQTVYQTATWWLIVVSWPLFLTLAIFGPALLGVFGPGFDQGATALAILSFAMLVNLGTGNVTVVLLMGGKSSWNLLNTAVALCLNVGLNLVLIPRFGMEGAAIAWAVSIVVDNLMALTEVWLFLGMRPFGRGYLPAVTAAVGCFGVVGLAARALPWARPARRSRCSWWSPCRCTRRSCGASGGGSTSTSWSARSAWDRGRGRASGGRVGSPAGGAGQQAAASASHGACARAWCMVTAPLRRPPDILMLGTKRGGSTSLAAYLYEHPQVLPPVPARLAPKGVRAFDEHPERGRWWYRSHFATVFVRGTARHRRRFAAESTANYLFHSEQAARAAVLAPDARAVVLLRDPVQRAWSHWRERTRRGLETLSFEDALAAEDERLGTLSSAARANVAYRAQGCYADFLPAWQAAFGDRLLVVFAEDLFADPGGTYARVVAFLGLEPFALASYEAWNRHPSPDAMDPATRASLEAFYEPYDARLADLLGEPFRGVERSEGVSPSPPDR